MWTNFPHGWSHFYHVEIKFIILAYKLELQNSISDRLKHHLARHSQTFKLIHPSQNHSQTFKLTCHSQNHSLKHPNQSLSPLNTLLLQKPKPT